MVAVFFLLLLLVLIYILRCAFHFLFLYLNHSFIFPEEWDEMCIYFCIQLIMANKKKQQQQQYVYLRAMESKEIGCWFDVCVCVAQTSKRMSSRVSASTWNDLKSTLPNTTHFLQPMILLYIYLVNNVIIYIFVNGMDVFVYWCWCWCYYRCCWSRWWRCMCVLVGFWPDIWQFMTFHAL